MRGRKIKRNRVSDGDMDSDEARRAKFRLSKSPRQCILAAKNGSVQIMGRSLHTTPVACLLCLHLSIFEMVSSHIRKPVPKEDDLEDLYINKINPLSLNIIFQLTGTSAFFDSESRQNELLHRWPDMFRWLKYLCELASTLLEFTNDSRSASVYLLSISSAIRAGRNCETICCKVLNDLVVFRFVAELWSFKDTSPTSELYVAEALYCFDCCNREEFVHFDIITQLLGDESDVAKHVLSRVRAAAEDPMDYSAIGAHIDVLLLFCDGDEFCYHPVRDAILTHHAVSYVVKILLRLISEPEREHNDKRFTAITSCLYYLENILGSADATYWIHLAIRHGIIGASFKLGSLYLRLDSYGREKVTEILSERLPSFLHFDKIVRSALRALQALPATDTINGLSSLI
ncbi:hypothetical protein DFH11DRAFT_1882417 [Phellopilus nigrolimitatus]|nr:hypothetical protein DFH11DRAFT_1882417 [Phellopilus nigrolimitatus]